MSPAARQTLFRSALRLVFSWRLLLVLLVLLGLVIGIWQAARLAHAQALESLYLEAGNELHLSAAGVESHLSRHDYLPRLLASRELVKRALTRPQAVNLLMPLNLMFNDFKTTANVSDIYLLDRHGTTLAASNWNLPHSFVGQNFSFRPYFKDAIAGHTGRFYGLGTQSGERGYYFSAPVLLEDGDETADGVVVVKVLIAPLEQAWNSHNGELLISDNDGVIFVASRPELRLTSLGSLSEHTLAKLRASRRYDGMKLPAAQLDVLGEYPDGSYIVAFNKGSLAGERYLMLKRDLPIQNWKMHILKPLSPLESAKWQAGLVAAGFYGVMILGSGIGWQRWRLRRERELFAERERRTLAEGQARVRGILDHTQAGLLVLDDRGALSYLNPTAQALFGHTPSGIEGRHLEALLSPADALRVATLRKARKTGPLEVLAMRAGGESFPVELTVSPLDSPQGARWLVTVFDISERKTQEHALARARDQLEQRVEERTRDLLESNRRLSREIEERKRAEANLYQTRDELIQAAKFAVLGQLAAGINHELNQPLAAIRAYAENARAFIERGRSETADANLAQIIELTARMAEISSQLKQFSRKSGDNLTPVSVQACFQYALRLYHSKLTSDSVIVETRWPQDDVWVRADLVRLEQVMVNLIGNALQAMAETSEARLILSITADDRQVYIGVHDNGPGIAEALLGKVFEPFFTTKSAGKGLGLGLSISARIVDDLGGRLEAGHGELGGARFTIILPIHTIATHPFCPLSSEEPTHV